MMLLCHIVCTYMAPVGVSGIYAVSFSEGSRAGLSIVGI